MTEIPLKLTRELTMKIWIRSLLMMLLSVVYATAMAGTVVPYTPAGFDRLMQQGKPVVVDIFAPWCPVCQAQHPVIESLAQKPAAADLTVMVVDFDHDKPAVQRFGAQYQSTLIAFRHGREVDRSVGQRQADAITALFQHAER